MVKPIEKYHVNFVEDLCRCLAYHTVDSEITLSMMDPPDEGMADEIGRARALIAAAGFEFDVLYPVADRPVVVGLN